MRHYYYIGMEKTDPEWQGNALRLCHKIHAAFKARTGRDDLVVGNYLESFEQKNGMPTGRIYPVDVRLRHGKFDESLAKELVAAISEVYTSLGVEIVREGDKIFTVCESERFLIGYRMEGAYDYGMKILPGDIAVFAWYEDELEEINRSVRL